MIDAAIVDLGIAPSGGPPRPPASPAPPSAALGPAGRRQQLERGPEARPPELTITDSATYSTVQC